MPKALAAMRARTRSAAERAAPKVIPIGVADALVARRAPAATEAGPSAALELDRTMRPRCTACSLMAATAVGVSGAGLAAVAFEPNVMGAPLGAAFGVGANLSA